MHVHIDETLKRYLLASNHVVSAILHVWATLGATACDCGKNKKSQSRHISRVHRNAVIQLIAVKNRIINIINIADFGGFMLKG